VSGQLPPDHPSRLSKTHILSTLPAEKLNEQAHAHTHTHAHAQGGGGGGAQIKTQTKAQGGRGGGGGGGAKVLTKAEKDKKTIARLKKLIKYKK
jgi:hypothetical protein